MVSLISMLKTTMAKLINMVLIVDELVRKKEEKEVETKVRGQVSFVSFVGRLAFAQ